MLISEGVAGLRGPAGGREKRGMRHRVLVSLLVVLAVVLGAGGAARAQQAPPFAHDFKSIADAIPDVVGEPTEDSHWGTRGDLLQRTTRGLMVWRSVDGWTAFTNGFKTWINGPRGLQERSNTERFEWEVPVAPPSAPREGNGRSVSVTWSTEPLADGHRLFFVVITNNHPYATASDVRLTEIQANRDGAGATEQLVPLDRTTLRPGERARWELNTSRQFSSRELAAAYLQYYANQTRWGLEYRASWRWAGQTEWVQSQPHRVPPLR